MHRLCVHTRQMRCFCRSTQPVCVGLWWLCYGSTLHIICRESQLAMKQLHLLELAGVLSLCGCHWLVASQASRVFGRSPLHLGILQHQLLASGRAAGCALGNVLCVHMSVSHRLCGCSTSQPYISARLHSMVLQDFALPRDIAAGSYRAATP